jgi:hypothetical protein
MAELDLSVKPRQLADALLRLLSERPRPRRS